MRSDVLSIVWTEWKALCVKEANEWLAGDQRKDRVHDLWEKFPDFREDLGFWSQLKLYRPEYTKVRQWVFHTINADVDTPQDIRIMHMEKRPKYKRVNPKEETKYWEREWISSWD